MPCRRALVVLLAVFAFMPQKSSAADWMRLRSAHFTFEGDVGDKELRRLALHLEQFRAVLGIRFPSAKLVTPAPLTVVVLGHSSDIKTVAPLFQGKPIDVAGFAGSSQFGPGIVICVERRDRGYAIAYHEYTHLVVANLTIDLPAWLNEGLAEFYSTFEMTEDGRRATLGAPVSEGEVGLVQRGLLPMSELLAADHQSRLYNVSVDRNLFYAQSWALVHYLTYGNPARAREFEVYVRKLSAGVPAQAAFNEAFSNADKLETELAGYLRQYAITVRQLTLRDPVTGAGNFTLTPMTPAEAQATMGLVLVRQQRFAEAQDQFQRALVKAPQTASAQTGLGMALVLQGKVAEGLPALRKGAELAAEDAMAHFAFGFGALECMSSECLKEQGGRETARKEFQRAVDIQPEFPEALARLGWTEADTSRDVASAERHLLQAIAFLPGREDYRLNLAQIYLRQENEAKVQEMLGPIAAASPSSENKAKAREMLGALARLRAAREERLAAQPVDSAPPAAGGGTPAASSAETGTRESEATPVYRVVGARERRARGELSAIECAQGAIAVIIRDAVGTHRFWAPSLDRIDFITYRDDLRGNVSCGRQPGAMQVYLTWRAPAPAEAALPAGTEGRVVAIEYLPKGK